MQLAHIYVNFPGNTKQAIEFYATVRRRRLPARVVAAAGEEKRGGARNDACHDTVEHAHDDLPRAS